MLFHNLKTVFEHSPLRLSLIYEINVKFQDTNFMAFAPRKSVSIHGFRIVASFILMILVILLENDNVFKLLIYLEIYFFFLCGHFACLKYWGTSVKDSKFIEAFILRCLLITCANKVSEILTLKLAASLRLFPTC